MREPRQGEETAVGALNGLELEATFLGTVTHCLLFIIVHALKNVDLQVSSTFCTLDCQNLPENRIGYITSWSLTWKGSQLVCLTLEIRRTYCKTETAKAKSNDTLS